MLQAILRARIWRGKGFIPYPPKPRFYYGGLHCGECFDVFVRGKWKPTRIEYGDNWYLVGIRAEDLNGLRVRI
ncbi:hypothetical protein GPK80_01940 [Coprococcus comes]|nr:hypothetical protein [Coprococcus comes]